jgi:hypothetical protein
MDKPSSIRRAAGRAGRVLCAVIAALMLGTLIVGFPAAWPTRIIRVYVPASDKVELEPLTVAMSKWNQANVGERFGYTNVRADADVVVHLTQSETSARSACHEAPWTASVEACTDWAGWKPWGPVTLDFVQEGDLSGSEADTLAAHELGHVLGLLHTSSPPSGPHCLIMDPDASCNTSTVHFGPVSCDRYGVCGREVMFGWTCGPMPGDVLAARALYGGPGSARYDPDCHSVWWQPYSEWAYRGSIVSSRNHSHRPHRAAIPRARRGARSRT